MEKRIIKFRVWDKVLLKMLYQSPSLVIRLSGAVTDGSTTPDVELMQFTGLKDSKGVEIYEGDILESQAFIDTFQWQDGCYCFDRDLGSLPIGDHYPFRVIGNIYESPDLLKGERASKRP